MNKIAPALLLALALCLTSACTVTTTGTSKVVTASNVSSSQFVSQLVSDAQNGSVPQGYSATTIVKTNTLQPGFFVIYDSATKEDTAVNLGWAEASGFSAEQIVQYFVYSDQHLNGNTTFTSTAGTATDGTTGSEDLLMYSQASNAEYFTGNPFFGATYQSQFDLNNATAEGNLVLVTPNPQNPTGGTYVDGQNELYSQPGETRDTDLQQAQMQNHAFLQKAANVSATYSMSFTNALQITLLADKINATTEQALTDNDRQAINQSVLTLTGVSSDEITQAVQSTLKGDNNPANALLEKAAQNLGMPSSDTLRNQILPKLGVSLSQ